MYDPLKHGLECIPYLTVVRRNNTVNNQIPKRQFIPQFAGTCVRFFFNISYSLFSKDLVVYDFQLFDSKRNNDATGAVRFIKIV